MKAMLGKKIGMSQSFEEDGRLVPVTLIKAGPCVITQVKTNEKDDYQAVQIGFDEVEERKLSKPELGHLKKSGRKMKHLAEFALEGEYKVGQELTVQEFEGVARVNVSGISKGKGFQGVIKRHGFAGGPGSHGAHFHRAPGSIGASATPARVFKGMRLPGQMGSVKRTVRNLKVQGIDAEKGILAVKGAVPGGTNGILVITAVK